MEVEAAVVLGHPKGEVVSGCASTEGARSLCCHAPASRNPALISLPSSEAFLRWWSWCSEDTTSLEAMTVGTGPQAEGRSACRGGEAGM